MIKKQSLAYKFIENRFDKIDSSIKFNILKLIFRPDIYIPYIYFKLFNHKYITYSNYLNIKKFKILVDSFDSYFLSKNGLLFGIWEYKLSLFILKNLKPDDIFYDVGGNLGFYTFLSSIIAKKVYSFEPVKEYYNLLEENFKNYRNIKLFNIALSNFNGKAFIVYKSGFSFLTKKKNQAKHSEETKVLTLNSFCKNRKFPTFIKADIEGHEFNFLLGAEKILLHKPTLSIEIMYKNLNQGKKIIAFLNKFNYNCYYINKDINLIKVTNLGSYFKKNKLSVDNFIFK